MSNNNRIKLTNIIAKLPEEAIDTLYQTASAVASPRYVIPLLFQNFFVFSK